MEENLQKKENETTNKNTIIAVLIVVIVALICALVYFGFIKKDGKPVDNNGENNQQTNDNTNDETTSFTPWMKYLLEQNITKIEVSKVPCSEDNYELKTVILNTDQLKDAFKKFMNYKLKVEYMGGSGWTCGESLKIYYTKDGKEYEFEYLGSEGHIFPSGDGCKGFDDKDLENALYSSVDEKVNEEAKDQEDMCVFYDLIVSGNLFDAYFE